MCTVPNAEVGAALAHQLVGRQFAAAVAIVPGVRSVYRWRGAIHDRQELQLVVKTVRGRIADVRRCIATQHPYEVAECMALEVVDASPSYLEWLQVQTEPEHPAKKHP
ncbi:MAG: divalent-cation tolerance protein CutA [Nannocystaceae bacterium]